MHRTSLALVCVLAVILALLGVWWGGLRDTPRAPMGTNTAAPGHAAEEEDRRGTDVGTASGSDSTAQVGARMPDVPERTDARRAIRGNALLGRLVQGGIALGGCEIEAVENWRARKEARLATVTADPEGRFAIDRLPDGPVTLLFHGDGVPRPWLVRHAVGKPGGHDLGDIEVPVPGSLTGRVVADGRPVPSVRVFHHHRPGFSQAQFDRRSPAGEASDPSVVTDRDGRFRFEGLPPGDHFVLVESPDHADAIAKVDLAGGQDHDFGAIQLARGRTAFGRVFDASGSPIEGALVAPGGRLMGSVRTHARRGVRSASDGSFEVSGLGRQDLVAVEAEGYVPHSERVDEPARARVITLTRSLTVRGKVTGADGRSATVRLDAHVGGPGSLPPGYAYAVMGRDHPVDADGRFEVSGLGPGDYEVRATVEGYGSSAPIPFQLPREALVTVPVLPNLSVEVLVVDDTGAPVPSAQVVRDPGIEEYRSLYRAEDPDVAARILKAWRDRRRKVETDGEGRASIPVEPDVPLAIAARADGHLASAVIVERAVPGEPLRIVLERGGIIAGRLTDASGQRMFSLSVRAWLAEAGDDAKAAANEIAVDANGAFTSPALRPGTYSVAVYRFNATWVDDPSRRLPDVVPLLGDGVDERNVQTVTLGPAERIEIELAPPPLGWIRGQVTAAGVPQAGVVVFAENAEPAEGDFETWRSVDDEEAHSFRPYGTTDAEGRFAFAYASPGAWKFYARHPDAAYPTDPVTVRVNAPALERRLDLTLGGAVVRGSYALSSIPHADRARLSAYLFRARDAGADPFAMFGRSLPLTSGMRRVAVADGGRFEFPLLPPGRWVLRLVAGRNRIEHQISVETTPNLAVDLGRIDPRGGYVEASVRCGSAEVQGAWVRQLLEGVDGGVFRGAVGASDGVLALGALPPGRYELTGFASAGNLFPGGADPRQPVGEPVEIEVHAGGSVTPATVF